MKRAPFLFLALLLFTACGKRIDRLEYSLAAAGANRPELEKVLKHYRGDTQKYRAAEFLIANLWNKFSLDSLSVRMAQPYYDALIRYRDTHDEYGDYTWTYFLCDSVARAMGTDPRISPRYNADAGLLSSDFLIRHIDRSFESWQKSVWAREVGFEDFCRYILPYKSDLSHWEGEYPYLRTLCSPLLDTCAGKSMTETGRIIDNYIKSLFRQDGPFLLQYGFLSPTTKYNYMRALIGSCSEINRAVVSALRDAGIPAAIDFIPYWGNSNASHSWAAIIGDGPDRLYDNEQIEYRGAEDDNLVNDIFWFKYPFEHYRGIPERVGIRSCRTVPKVYRERYETGLNPLATDGSEVPGIFRNAGLEDVTDRYIECADVTLRLKGRRHGTKYAYLCCYDPERIAWTPVAWGRIAAGGSARFPKMGKNIVYLPAYYEQGTIVPAGAPFLLTGQGEIKSLKASEQKIDRAVFYSKVPYRTHLLFWASDLIGARFQLANRPDLSDTLTVHTIDRIPYYGQEAVIENAPASRYGLFDFSANLYGFLAELEFWGDDGNGRQVKLQGRPIGNPGAYGSENSRLWDGNRESFFCGEDKSKGHWTGLDFGKPCKVSRIVYHPRSDDNGIVPGEQYELFYWTGDSWHSLGRQEGRPDRTLVYTDLPDNVLLRLHNHTRGKENRIFLYQDDRQVFY